MMSVVRVNGMMLLLMLVVSGVLVNGRVLLLLCV
jgi:hypothetical protein